MSSRSFLLPILVCCCSSAALAQVEPPDSTRMYRAPGVVVLAPRMSGTTFTTSLAVSAVSAGDLPAVRLAGIDAWLGSIGGVLAQTRAGGQDVRLTVRGFGARGAGDRSNAGTSRGVRLILDRAPETEPDGRTSFDLVDPALISRAEIVRSNASFLWGNASGGTLLFSTLPDAFTPPWSVQGSAGSFGFSKAAIQAVARTDAGLFHAQLSRSAFDGWRTNAASTRTLVNIGTSSDLTPTDRLETHVSAVDSRFEIPGPLSRQQFDADASQANPTYLGRHERRWDRIARVVLSAQRSFNDSAFVGVSAFITPKDLRRSERGTYRTFFRYHTGGSVIAQAVVRAGGTPLRLLAGADVALQDGPIRFYSLSPANERGSTVLADKREGASTKGAFVEAEARATDELRLTAALRREVVRYDYRDLLAPNLNDERSFEQWLPRVGVSWTPSPAFGIYASASRGMEVPAGNETDPAGTFGVDTVRSINPLLDPIRSTTLEAGLRQVMTADGPGLIRGLSYDIAVFAINVEDDIVPYRGGRFYFTAGRTHRFGAEGTGHVDLAGGWSLAASLTLMDARYDAYTVDSVHYGKPGAFADRHGNAVAGIPSSVGTIRLRYSPGERLPFFVEVGARLVGEYPADDAGRFIVPGATVVQAAIGTTGPLDVTLGIRITASVSVENVFDAKYPGSAFINPDIVGGVPVYLEPGMPRSITLTLSCSPGP